MFCKFVNKMNFLIRDSSVLNSIKITLNADNLKSWCFSKKNAVRFEFYELKI